MLSNRLSEQSALPSSWPSMWLILPRAVLFDRWGRSVEGVEARRSHTLTFGSDGEASADPDALVDLLTDCIDATLRVAGPLAAGIAAVAGCSLAGTLLGVDETGRPVTPLITYADTRATAEAVALRSELDEAIFHQRTGTRFHSSYWPAQLRWLQRSRPELFRRVVRWMTWGEYLEMRLFGQGATSLSAASWSGLLRREHLDWDPQLVAALPVTAAQLPELVDSSTPRRGLRGDLAARWPALRDAPWFPMIGDGAAANIGSGCVSPGRVALTVGTTSALRAVVTDPALSLPTGLWCYRVDSRRLLPGGALTEGGGVFAWLRRTLRLGDPIELEAALAGAEPDAHGLTVLPFFAGERSPGWDGNARATIHGLSLATRPEDIARAGLEAVALRIALVYNQLRSVLPPAAGYRRWRRAAELTRLAADHRGRARRAHCHFDYSRGIGARSGSVGFGGAWCGAGCRPSAGRSRRCGHAQPGASLALPECAGAATTAIRPAGG